MSTTNGDAFPIELFAVGRHAGLDWTPADLDAMAMNHSLLKGKVTPAIKLGHGDQVLAGHDPEADPALGWIENVRRVGDKLIGDVTGAPSIVKEAIRKGLYRRCSAELYPDWSKTSYEGNLHSGATGPVLSAVALLGWKPPEVKSLRDLSAYLTAEHEAGKLTLAESNGATCVTLDCAEAPTRIEKPPTQDERLDALTRDVAEMKAQSKRLAERASALIGEKKDMAGQKQFAAAGAATFRAELERFMHRRGMSRNLVQVRREAAKALLLALNAADADSRALAANLLPSEFDDAITKSIPGQIDPMTLVSVPEEKPPVGTATTFPTPAPGYRQPSRLAEHSFTVAGHAALVRMSERGDSPAYGSRSLPVGDIRYGSAGSRWWRPKAPEVLMDERAQAEAGIRFEEAVNARLANATPGDDAARAAAAKDIWDRMSPDERPTYGGRQGPKKGPVLLGGWSK